MEYILVVDDDATMCKLVKKCLERSSFVVYTFAEGREALTFFQESKDKCTLAILDVMLPGIDGYEVMRNLRKQSNLPILMLTAKDQEQDKIFGLQNGADDYLTKPFGLDELSARVSALIRRYTTLNPQNINQEHGVLCFRELEINPLLRSVEVSGSPVSLTGKEFDILYFLAKERGRIFTKQQIYQQIWKEEYVNDDGNIMAIISKLRKKIEPCPEHPSYILTIYGIGYRFNNEE